MERNPFDRYVDDIINSSKLSADEEYDLSLRIQSGDKRAIDRLTTANLKFVIVLSRQYQGRGVDIDDLVPDIAGQTADDDAAKDIDIRALYA